MLIATSKLDARRNRRKLGPTSEFAIGQSRAREQEAARRRALRVLKDALQVVQEAALVVKECNKRKPKKQNAARAQSER
jgi:hypothetical protein